MPSAIFIESEQKWHKECRKCKSDYVASTKDGLLSFFTKTIGNNDGLDYTCKKCKKEKYDKNRDKILTGNRERYKNSDKTERKIKDKARYLKNREHIIKKQCERQKRNRKEKKLYDKEYRLKKFGLTIEGYEEIAKSQDYKCELCNKERELVLDHDHETGKFRGLICNPCNQGIGLLKDNIQTLKNAIKYLKDSKK